MKYLLLPFRLLFRLILLLFGFLIYAPFMLIKEAIWKKETKSTPKIHTAIKEKDIDSILLLLENGANVNELDNLGLSPLKSAIQNNSKDIVNILLEHGADVESDNPLSTVCYYENIDIEIVQSLLKHGADPLYCNPYGDNLIHTSIKLCREDIIDLLLEYGANINGQNYDHGDTPLHQQSYTGTSKTIELLLKKGADIDNQNIKGSTPLILSCSQEIMDIERVKTLLKNGANTDIQNEEGLTALIAASFRGHINAVNLLLEYGVDQSIECYLGDKTITALSAATDNGHIEIVNLLQKS